MFLETQENKVILAEPIPINYNDNNNGDSNNDTVDNNGGDGVDIINNKTKMVSYIIFQILKKLLKYFKLFFLFSKIL